MLYFYLKHFIANAKTVDELQYYYFKRLPIQTSLASRWESL